MGETSGWRQIQGAVGGAIEESLETGGGPEPVVPLRPPAAPRGVVCIDPSMRGLYDRARRVAVTSLPVLVVGETGAGKEPVMRAIHEHSGRSGRCVVVNCAAIPASLLESELFGHERGAFTGASQRRLGVFECAHGGTVCLDEIGELSLGGQAALLRVLETRRLHRVGGHEEIEVDVRLVAATHRDLPRMIEARRFRQDLYYRLNAVTLEVPPLRERASEIPALARHFLAETAARSTGAPSPRELTPEATAALRAHAWPGNVRELRNVMARAVALGEGTRIDVADLVVEDGSSPLAASDAPATTGSRHAFQSGMSLRRHLQRYEAYVVQQALRHTGGHRGRAAALLDVPTRTFQRRLKQHGREVESA